MIKTKNKSGISGYMMCHIVALQTFSANLLWHMNKRIPDLNKELLRSFTDISHYLHTPVPMVHCISGP